MRVEVVAVETCPRCKGTKRVREDLRLPAGVINVSGECPTCNGTGLVRTVLATLPDRAELRERLLMDLESADARYLIRRGASHSIPSVYRARTNSWTDAVLALFGLGAEE